MTDAIKKSRTETFEHTISGLLTKRVLLFHEAERIRDRQAEIRNDIQALDRVLGTLGYTGNLDTQMPRQKRQAIFGTGELTGAIFDILRESNAVTTRTIARHIINLNEQDPKDRRLLTDIVRRCSKALRVAKNRGYVVSSLDRAGNMIWSRKKLD